MGRFRLGFTPPLLTPDTPRFVRYRSDGGLGAGDEWRRPSGDMPLPSEIAYEGELDGEGDSGFTVVCH